MLHLWRKCRKTETQYKADGVVFLWENLVGFWQEFNLIKGRHFEVRCWKKICWINQRFFCKRLAWHGKLCWLDTESNIAVVCTQAWGLNGNLITSISMKTTSPEVEKQRIGSRWRNMQHWCSQNISTWKPLGFVLWMPLLLQTFMVAEKLLSWLEWTSGSINHFNAPSSQACTLQHNQFVQDYMASSGPSLA